MRRRRSGRRIERSTSSEIVAAPSRKATVVRPPEMRVTVPARPRILGGAERSSGWTNTQSPQCRSLTGARGIAVAAA